MDVRRTLPKVFALALWTVLLAAPACAFVSESGTLRGFLLGDCPTCGYDNWKSHVVEGVAAVGYNDFGPAWFDPQKNGFGHYTDILTGAPGDQTLAQWRAVFTACALADWSAADSLLAQHWADWRYELVEFNDTERKRTYFIVREQLDSSFTDANVDSIPTDDVTGSFQNGWGVFVFSATPLFSKLIVQMPHPEDDFLAIPLGIDLFLRTGARALMIAGASREALWTTALPPYANDKSLSDPSRNDRTPFARCHEALFDALDGGPASQLVTVQMHSYDHALHRGHKDIQLTAFADDNRPNPPLRDRAEHKDVIHFAGRYPVQGLPGYPALHAGIGQYIALMASPAYAYYGAADTVAISSNIDLPGYGWNRQAVYSHRTHDVARDPENFIHIEVDEYPDSLWSPVNWRNWLPGAMPASWETFRLALAYYEPFLAALDSALRHSHLYPDVTPPATVHLTPPTFYGADSVRLTWTTPATDRFFDTYQIFYDTASITSASPVLTRTIGGLSSLQDFATTSVLLKNLPLPVTRYRFAVGSRDIFGNAAQRSNPSDRTDGMLAFVLADPYIGVAAACQSATVFVTFDAQGFRIGRFFVILPPALEAAWETGTGSQNVLPSANRAANLALAIARRVGSATSDTLEVTVQWAPPYSDGDAARFIAALPIRHTGTQSEPLLVTGGDSSVFHDGAGDNVNTLYAGTATLVVDAAPPAVTLAFGGNHVCARGNAASLRGLLRANALRGAMPQSAPLVYGYLEINGDSTRRLSLFESALGGDYASGPFPDSAQAPTLWSLLSAGCNTLVLHAFDSECNEGLSSPLALVVDTTAPALTVFSAPVCYSPGNYRALLRDSLAIIATLDTGCAAQSGTLTLWRDGDYRAFSRDLCGAPFPAADSDAAALWTWLITESGVPPTANGEAHLFHARATDCAGNASETTFTLCLDLTNPPNTVTAFVARPAHRGVWLHWQWDPAQAVVMEVWRSPYVPGDYPAYAPPNPSRWQNLADSTSYPRAYPPAGWTRVVRQTGQSGTSSAAYSLPNGQGNCIHALTDSTCWLDADALWTDSAGGRDIYRYVTFVQDAAGNGSSGSALTLHQNADRATNYWLGDFVPADGRVDSEDLIALSEHYFTVVDPAWAYLDIGPEDREHGFGKGQPLPDGHIDFFDLLPFSDNYGVVAPVGYPGELSPPPILRKQPAPADDHPTVLVARLENGYIPVGTDFSVMVSLSGNAASSLRIVEAGLDFDPEILELVSVSAVPTDGLGGVPFTKAARVAGQAGTVGIVAAAIGEAACITGDLALTTITFRWHNTHEGRARVDLGTVRLASVSGDVTLGAGNAIDLRASGVIPRRFALHANFPNPFNPTTTLRFDLPVAADVRLTLYNVLGQEVRTLLAAHREAGEHALVWDGTDHHGRPVSSGVYICRLRAAANTGTIKMLLTR